MTPATAVPTVGGSLSLRALVGRATLPIVALLVAQVGLYVWMAPRGFDFTDETYYILNYLYWRELVGVVSFFGAYIELPFRMLGQNVPAIRIFSLLLLLGSGAFFTREALRYFARRDGATGAAPWPFMAVGAAASLFYFGYLSTLRAPSYNLLALCSMLVATGLLLRLLEPRTGLGDARVAPFCYGVALGVCGLSKASSAVMLVACHALFFVFANRDWRPRHMLELLALSLAGAGLNFALLQWAHPQWLAALREGVALFSYSNGSNLLGMVNTLRWDIQKLAPMLPWALGAMLAFVVLVRWTAPLHGAARSALVVVLVAGCVLGLMWEGHTRLWLPLLGVAVLLLWSVEVISRKPLRLLRGDAADLGLMCLLFALPVAFSFGTSNPVLEHSQIAGVFPVAALLLRLHRLCRVGLLAAPSVVVCLTALCVPTLVLQIKIATDVRHSHRLLSALGEQTMPVRVGAAGNTLLVDAATLETLQSVMGAARATGFVAGQAILDFTGDGPGLIYALGGRPLGLAWLLGGYPDSQTWAERLLVKLPKQALQNAWLLSSDDNPRAITAWKKLLSERIGAETHERVATIVIRAPYRWGDNAPETITVQLWKPRAPAEEPIRK